MLSACKTQDNFIISENINNKNSFKNEGIIYTLPQTKIIVEVEINKIIKIKGPYADFTNQYLGKLSNIIQKNEIIWQIANINFHTIPIPDTNNTYVLSSNFLPVNLTQEGFLIGYNCPNINYSTPHFDFNTQINGKNYENNYTFDLLPSDKNYKIVYDTVYKEQVFDTIIRKVPILKPNLVRKTTAEQAKELADRLMTLRDDRAALLVGEGDNDYLPTGDALKLMLSEIDKLEASYLSMFIGKTDTVKYTYTFSYIPIPTDNNKQIILFKFSEHSGLLPADNLYGKSVFLEINTDEQTKQINKYQDNRFFYFAQTKNKSSDKAIYYRIPQQTKLRIVYNNQVIAEQTEPITQLGTTDALPTYMFDNQNIKIEFYPQLGAIKKIFYDK